MKSNILKISEFSDPNNNNNKVLVVTRLGEGRSFYSEEISKQSEPVKYFRMMMGIDNKDIHKPSINRTHFTN